MLKRYQDARGNALRIADACVMVGAWLAAYGLRFMFPFKIPLPVAITQGDPAFLTYAALSPLVAILWMTVLTWTGAYRAGRRLGDAREGRVVMRGHLVALLLFIALTYFFKYDRYSRLVMAYFAALGGVGLLVLRGALRSGLRDMLTRRVPIRTALAVGEGAGVENLIERLNRLPTLGLRVQGVLTSQGSPLREVAGTPVVGHYSDIADVIAKTAPDEVLIALPHEQSDHINHLLEILKDATVDVRLLPDVHRYVTLGCGIELFDGLPVVRINDSPVIGWAGIGKRLTDEILSAVACALLSPILLLIAVAIKLTSSGPILYIQERMGLDGHSFSMFKFRTMRCNAEAVTGAIWTKPNDNRCTAIGSFLRRTSLDELPQLWNVLRGEMSLVGPRPERPCFVAQFRDEIPHYMLRHKVRAGMTGWAQVNGWRGNTSLARRIECDLHYIRNWSYGLDLMILFMTVWKGFIHRNAY